MFGLTPYSNRRSLQRRGIKDIPDIFDAFNDFFNDGFGSPMLNNDAFRVDVKDNGDQYLIEADLPGVSKDEVCIDYYDGRLVISVSKNEEVEEEKENYLHKERRSSSMRRGVYLNDIKEDDIQAQLKDGVLKITAPKLDKPNKGKRIDIQ